MILTQTKTYMSNNKELKSIRDAIIAADNSLKTAKALLSSMLWWETKDIFEISTQWMSAYNNWDIQIVEWVFTWENMLWPEWNTYPVPHNYASKSLLVQWSRLKAIIQPNWKITYKIIDEIPYETKLGIITKNWEKLQITTKDKTYNVLVAAITFHKCNIWDTVSIRIPKWKDATYAVIENIVPKS